MENDTKNYIVTIDGPDCTGKSTLWKQALGSVSKNIQIRGIVSNIAYAIKYKRNVDELIELYNQNPIDYCVYLLNPINDKKLEMLYNRIRNTIIYDNNKIIKELKDASETWTDIGYFNLAIEKLQKEYKGTIKVIKSVNNDINTFKENVSTINIKDINSELYSGGIKVLRTTSDRFEAQAKELSEFKYIVLFDEIDKIEVINNLYEGLDDEHQKMFDKLLEYSSDSKYDIYDALTDLNVDCLVDFLENYKFKCEVTAKVELTSDTEIYVTLKDLIDSYCLEDVIYDDSTAMDDIYNDLEYEIRNSDVEIQVDRVY